MTDDKNLSTDWRERRNEKSRKLYEGADYELVKSDAYADGFYDGRADTLNNEKAIKDAIEALKIAMPQMQINVDEAVEENFGIVGSSEWANKAVDERNKVDAALTALEKLIKETKG